MESPWLKPHGLIQLIMKPKTLSEVAKWDAKTVVAFNHHLLNFRATPPSRSLVNAMIKFEEMYQPLTKNPFSVDLFGRLEGINEGRRAQRSRAYIHRKDLLVSVDGKSGKTLILTTRAHRIFYQSFPLAKLRKEKWDGFWTLVMYDFPETRRTDRDSLRRKLKDLGFGCPQESILVSPLSLARPVKELLDGERVDGCAWVLRSQRILGIEDKEVARQAWDIEQFNCLYKNLLNVLPEIKKPQKPRLLDSWREYFLAVYLSDPYLPRELLPEDWLGETCQKEFLKLGALGFLKAIFS